MLVSESVARDLVRLITWFPFRWALESLPAKTAYGLLRAVADAHMALGGGGKIQRNMREVFPGQTDAWFRDQARKCYEAWYVNQLQVIVFPQITRRCLPEILTWEGLEHVREALKAGKGAILLHAHYGPIHLPLHALGLLGWPVMQLGLRTDEGLSAIGQRVAFRLRERYEARIHAPIIMVGRFLKPLFKWLKENGVLMMTGDGAGRARPAGRQLVQPFLGSKMLFPIGAASLAARTGAALLFMTTHRTEAGRFLTRIEPPCFVAGEADGKSGVRETTGRFAEYLEAKVLSNPGPWFLWDEANEIFDLAEEFEAGRIVKMPSLQAGNGPENAGKG